MKKEVIRKLMFPLCAILINLTFAYSAFAQNPAENEMQVHFINVGQADAALLEFSCGAVLIDAGAQDIPAQQSLIQYLHRFFTRRPDLNNTLDLVLISHDHIDHNFALKSVAQAFHIKNYIDNGHVAGSGQVNQGWMERNAQSLGTKYENFSYEQITAAGNHQGITDEVIEPLHCATVTPQISILSGRFQSRPDGWKATDYSNENNHSLVVRVQFGSASFLFTGDLETAGDHQLATYYKGTGVLDVDVWKVSHHGAVNGTGKEFLDAITPNYAVVSCGQWNFGQGPPIKTFSTYAYGHPRILTLDSLSQSIPLNRPQPIIVKASSGQYRFSNYTVTKNIYSTAWDGNITIRATSSGVYSVVTHDN